MYTKITIDEAQHFTKDDRDKIRLAARRGGKSDFNRQFIKAATAAGRTVLEVRASIVHRPPETVRDAAFYRTAGYNAQRLGLKALDCPYRGDSRARAWVEGYTEAKRTHAAPMACSTPPVSSTTAKGPFKTVAEFQRAAASRFSSEFMDRKRQINYRRTK